MRTLLACAALAALTLPGTPAAAQGAWCSEDMNSRNCGWYTLEQCRAGASGNGGSCFPNAAAPRAAAVEPPRRARHVKPHH